MSAPTFEVSTAAYAKLVLHAAKYPTEPIYGVLLAEAGASATAGGKQRIVDAVPLFHSHWILTPSLQLGMEQASCRAIEIYAKQAGLKIAGAYAANELETNRGVEPAVGAAAAQIDTHTGGHALLLVFDPIQFKKGRFAAVPYGHQSGAWRELAKAQVEHDDGAIQTAAKLVKDQAFASLFDLDNHLDDISLDWIRNPDVKI
ncbi:hypothetical protein HK105_206605 [Polyrhizophydium stewartii]|uniref:MPN domain-containing protein n=1 Tax=Polyrhizophydium stewartii TaxID=2732419 RepID=A0ABR4N2W6_9FUNG|nr:ER membrane protein complex subunit 8 [Polyrhizophydium stewartii]